MENRRRLALAYQGLKDIGVDSSISLLSGGKKTKVLLAGLALHTPEIVLLDEPTDNLDLSSLSILANTIKNYRGTSVNHLSR